MITLPPVVPRADAALDALPRRAAHYDARDSYRRTGSFGGAPATLHDLSGNMLDQVQALAGQRAMLVDAPGLGPAWQFDGLDDSYATPAPVDRTGAQTLNIMALAVFDPPPIDWYFGGLWSHGDVTQPGDGYLDVVRSDTGARLSYAAARGNVSGLSTLGTIDAGPLPHVLAAEIDFADPVPTGEIELYLDGTFDVGAPFNPGDNTSVFGVRVERIGFDGSAPDFWRGLIAEIHVWDVALTPAQTTAAAQAIRRARGLP